MPIIGDHLDTPCLPANDNNDNVEILYFQRIE